MTAGAPARWRVDLSLVLVTLIWGATFVLVKRALGASSGRNSAGALAGCFLFTGYIL
jgi:hypothetical protein